MTTINYNNHQYSNVPNRSQINFPEGEVPVGAEDAIEYLVGMALPDGLAADSVFDYYYADEEGEVPSSIKMIRYVPD